MTLFASLLAALTALTTTTGPRPEESGAHARRLADAVEVEPLAEGIWLLRTTHQTETWGLVGANGLAVVSGDEALLVDPGWDDRQADTLLAWARDELHARRIQALVTHAHDDRIGGIRALLAREVPVLELARTADLAAHRGYPPPTRTFDREARLQVGSLGVEVLFPGAGHTSDNVVAFVPDRHVLFGGCLVKDASATTLGNVAEADIRAWPASIAAVKARFGGATIVVPGHGTVGGAALLDHTLELAKASAPASPVSE